MVAAAAVVVPLRTAAERDRMNLTAGATSSAWSPPPTRGLTFERTRI